MSGRNRRRVVTKKELSAEKKPIVFNLSNEARERVDGLTGIDLAKEMRKMAMERIEADNFGSTLDTPLLKLAKKFRLPPESEMTAPVAFIPSIIDRVHDELCFNKKNRVILDCRANVEEMGQKMLDVVSRCMNVSNCVEIVGSILADTETALKPFNHPGLFNILKVSSRTTMTMVYFLMKNIVPSNVSGVEVCLSPVHGNGVFAVKDFKYGDILTTYPADYLSIDKDEGAMWIATDPLETLDEQTLRLIVPYALKIDDTPVQIAGKPDVHHPHRCAHLINDGASITKADFTHEDVVEYINESVRFRNCMFISLGGIVVVAMATRDIKAGEEIFTEYSAAYWAKYAYGEI